MGLYITVVPNPTNLSNFCGARAAVECTAVFSGDGDPATNNITSQGVYGPGNDYLVGTSFDRSRQDITTIDGNGWVPANFTKISGGSPINRLPLDPNFSINNFGDVTANDRLCIFVCKEITLEYEIMANLESEKFSLNGSNDKESTDGGNSSGLYEVGTNLHLLKDP